MDIAGSCQIEPKIQVQVHHENLLGDFEPVTQSQINLPHVSHGAILNKKQDINPTNHHCHIHLHHQDFLHLPLPANHNAVIHFTGLYTKPILWLLLFSFHYNEIVINVKTLFSYLKLQGRWRLLLFWRNKGIYPWTPALNLSITNQIVFSTWYLLFQNFFMQWGMFFLNK